MTLEHNKCYNSHMERGSRSLITDHTKDVLVNTVADLKEDARSLGREMLRLFAAGTVLLAAEATAAGALAVVKPEILQVINKISQETAVLLLLPPTFLAMLAIDSHLTSRFINRVSFLQPARQGQTPNQKE